MKQKEAHKEKMEAKVKEWEAKIDVLKAKAEYAKADAKINYQKLLDDVKVKTEAGKEMLEDFKEDGEKSWEKLKSEIEDKLGKLGEKMNLSGD